MEGEQQPHVGREDSSWRWSDKLPVLPPLQKRAGNWVPVNCAAPWWLPHAGAKVLLSAFSWVATAGDAGDPWHPWRLWS